jgi:microcin C transport system substrate-binding protein
MRISIRAVILSLYVFSQASMAQESVDERKHGLSLFGTPALEKGFSHFPYVNTTAPKGGNVRIAAIGSFDSLNSFTIKGNYAEGLGMVHATLMKSSLNEASASYGWVAEAISHPADFSSATLYLRPEARFHDGTALTAEDVAFSLDALKASHPFYRAYYGDVVETQILDPYTITFKFSQTGNRELPLILGQLPVLSKAYWSAEGRSLGDTTLDIFPASGPYRIAARDPGRAITYERVADYWGNDLNVSVGHYNFDSIKYIYFGDDTVAFEALKAGDVHYRREFSSRIWATGYDTPAIDAGDLQRETVVLNQSAGMQAFIFNTRRAPFDDIQVRAALNWAYDFEWTKKNLFYGQYARNDSFFQGSELAASGPPSEAELKLLEPLRADVPAAVFGPPVANPVSDGSGNIRPQLRKARALLEKAGWQIVDGKLMRNGEDFEIEFLLVQPAFERIVAPYIQNLKRLGIGARIRVIDPTQYQNRVTNYDYDAIVYSFPQSLSPGNEQRDFWTSAAAERPGGRNVIGIKDKAVDSLVESLIYAKSRAELVAASRALDRVLLANHYVVPQWYSPHERLAYWRGLAHRSDVTLNRLSFPHLWWRDAPHPTDAQSAQTP